MTELFPPSSSRKPPAVRKVTAEATIRDVGRVDLASSNTSSTILPQLSAEECQKRRRKCHSQEKHYNIIILDHYEQAGLGDRLFVIRRLAVLAGYLCARLYVPPPYTMLATFHNSDQEIPKNLCWVDMEDIRFLDDNSSAIVPYQLDPVDEHQYGTDPAAAFHLNENYFKDDPKYSSWLRLRFQDHPNGNRLARVFGNQVKKLDNFVTTEQQQHDKPLERGFIWEVYPVLYHFYDAYTKWRRDIVGGNEKGVVSCPYTDNLKSTTSHQVKDRVIEFLQQEYPNSSHFIPLHIRRGDTKDVCDTSLAKMKDFLSCSFAGFASAHGNLAVVLLATDELDTCYRQAIQAMVQDLGHAFVDLDTLVWNVLRGFAAAQTTNHTHLLNNVFLYKVISNVRDDERMRSALEKRRDQCPECQSLATLLTRAETNDDDLVQLLSQSRDESSGKIKLQAILKAYESCSKEAKQDTT
ncbi:MAG: hypothetical protein SGBAC_009453 [Bacillariaceae sp.]